GRLEDREVKMPLDILDKLDPQFKALVEQLLANCAAQGVIMDPREGVRTPRDQAILWRQSHTPEEAHHEIQQLRNQGANFLAQCLESVNPHQGARVTNAIPGLSWHQWGEAVDCVWMVHGNEELSHTRLVGGTNGYRVYADEAKKLALTPG